MRKALKHAPTERIRKELGPKLKEVFNRSRREKAERYLRAPLKNTQREPQSYPSGSEKISLTDLRSWDTPPLREKT